MSGHIGGVEGAAFVVSEHEARAAGGRGIADGDDAGLGQEKRLADDRGVRGPIDG